MSQGQSLIVDLALPEIFVCFQIVRRLVITVSPSPGFATAETTSEFFLVDAFLGRHPWTCTNR